MFSFFFFSSRRRHTRYWRDWSSDVCSSDLKRGAFEQAIGRSRGGRTTTLHALSDDAGRPRVLLLAPGNQHDVTMAPELLRLAGPIRRLLADKAYDTNKLRRLLAEHGVEAVIPSIARRK